MMNKILGKKQKSLIGIFTVLLCCINVTCDLDPIKKAIVVIDKAINLLNERGTDAISVLKNVAKDIPEEAKSIINNDLTALSNNIIGATGVEAQCTLDFARVRAKQTLQNLKLKLQNLPYKVPPPGFCLESIPSIDLNRDPRTVSVYGFDLNSPDNSKRKIQAALVGPDTVNFINENLIGRNTNYELSLNINALLPQMVKNRYRKIQLYYNGSPVNMPEILIQDWVARTISVTFTPHPIKWVPPHEGASDLDFDSKPGNPTVGQVYMQYTVTPDSILARVFMDAMEFGGDNTRVGVGPGPTANILYYGPWTRIYTNSNPQYEITDFSPKTDSKQPFSIDEQGTIPFTIGGNTVAQWDITIDRKGPEAGTYTNAVATFNPLTVILKQKRPGN